VPRFTEADRRCAVIASKQHGLINRTQARRAGLNDKAIHVRLDGGRWFRILPEVFQLAGGEMNHRAWMTAAVLWAGDGSAISHSSAAAVWGLDGFSGGEPYHLTIGSKERSPDRRIRLHSCFELTELEPTVIDSVAATSVRKTLFDLAAVGHRRLERAFDQCLREGLVSLAEMWTMIDRPTSVGRRGIRLLRNVVIERDGSTAPTDSEMEDLLLRVVRDNNLPYPVAQHPITLSERTINVDFAYPECSLAIECDSYAWHMDRQAFERDRERDAEAQLLGWNVLRVTWAQLRHRSDDVAALIRRYLSRANATDLADPTAEVAVRAL
jgi:very-short-patch-repair endonuclease